MPKPEPSLPSLTEHAFCQARRGRRATDKDKYDRVTGSVLGLDGGWSLWVVRKGLLKEPEMLRRSHL